MKELRYIADHLETRLLDDGAMTLIGHASTFDEPYELWGFREQVKRGAFKRTIKGNPNIAALWNHDPNVVLGRAKSGTLRLSEDDGGLAYEIDLPDTQAARDLYTLIQRGDVYQSSFSFEVVSEKWDYPKDDMPTRTLTELKLYDISPVTYPANESTDVDIKRALRRCADDMHRDVSELVDAAKRGELSALATTDSTEPIDPPDDPQISPPPAPDRTRQALDALDLLVVELGL